MSLAEKFKDWVKGQGVKPRSIAEQYLAAAFYAGAEAVSKELPHDERMEFECEIEAFKKGATP